MSTRRVVFMTVSLYMALMVCMAGCKERSGQGPSDQSRGKISSQKVRTVDKAAPRPDTADQQGSLGGASEEAENAYFFDPAGKRDPFASFLQVVTSPESEKKEDVFLTPLERYSLDQLRLVGTVIGPGLQHALIEDDVGKGYTIRVGDRIGSEGGKVVAILKDRIVVEEVSQDVLGNRKVKRVEKKLYTPVEGGDS